MVYTETMEQINRLSANGIIGFLNAKRITEMAEVLLRNRSLPDVARALSFAVEVRECKKEFSLPDVISSGKMGGDAIIDSWSPRSNTMRSIADSLRIMPQFAIIMSPPTFPRRIHQKTVLILDTTDYLMFYEIIQDS